jgi:MoaA/NifB/PqqE/SkfB family radical SAM enzyme
MNDDIQTLLTEFKSRNIKNITEEIFIEKTSELFKNYSHKYSSLDEALKDIPLNLIVDKVIDETNLSFKDEKVKKLNFDFKNKKNCCLAPYSTINFDTMGEMRVCCYNTQFILGKYPEISIKDAWNSEKRKTFIEKLTNLDFSMGCQICQKQIIQNDIDNSLLSTFNIYEKDISDDYPISFSFDFGTICNYECIMCGGKWSSSIRKNREKLPPIKSPYDDSFVDQLEYFIPHLKTCNFLGGEPFLNPLYYKILDLIVKKAPDIAVNITTNGSIYNSRIKSYFEKLPNLNIIVSLDSLNEETYQLIRKNGNFKNVMNNIEEFKKHNVFKSITFCPMIQNVNELPDIITYCINNNIDLGINDVHCHLGGKIKGIHEGEDKNTLAWKGYPDTAEEVFANNKELIPEVVIGTLPKEELQTIIKNLINFLNDKKVIYENPLYNRLYTKYKSFLNKMLFIYNEKQKIQL